MLYDKRWDAKVETRADPFTLESLIAWLEKQPADGRYDFDSIHICALCQYGRSLGYREVTAGTAYFREGPDRTVHQIPGSDRVVGKEPFTFGAALERARALADR